MKRAAVLAFAVVLTAAVCAVGCTSEASADHPIGDFVGWHDGRGVYMCYEGEHRWVELRGENTERLDFFSVDVLPDGSLLLADKYKGLLVQLTDGHQVRILEPFQIAGSAWASPNGRFVAYSHPTKWDGDEPLSCGTAVYDLERNTASVLSMDDSYRPSIKGWLDNRVVFLKYDREWLYTVDLTGAEERLCLIRKNMIFFHGIRDGVLPYETTDGEVGVIHLRTGEIVPLLGASQLRWTELGVEALVGGERRLMLEVPSDRGGN